MFSVLICNFTNGCFEFINGRKPKKAPLTRCFFEKNYKKLLLSFFEEFKGYEFRSLVRNLTYCKKLITHNYFIINF